MGDSGRSRSVSVDRTAGDAGGVALQAVALQAVARMHSEAQVAPQGYLDLKWMYKLINL